MSKDLKPKQRIGQTAGSRRKKVIIWAVLLTAAGGGGYAAYRYNNVTKVEVPVSKVKTGEFVISVRTRGEIKSVRSEIMTAPQVPDPANRAAGRIGPSYSSKGEVVVEFDAAQQEQTYLESTTSVRTVDSEIVQTKASHRITNEQDR